MPAIEWTDEEIERRARISAEDLALLLAWWQANASRRDKLALERLNGAPMDRRILDRVLLAVARENAALANALRTGDMPLEFWQESMADMVQRVQLAGGVAAAGGIDVLTLRQGEIIQDRTKEQLAFLLAFALAIQSGEQRKDGRLSRRAQMYAHAGRGTYHDIERQVMVDQGYTEEARIRTAHDSCDDCIDLDIDHRGWQPIGTLPRLGESQCKTNCLCYFAYRRVSAGESETVPSGLKKYYD